MKAYQLWLVPISTHFLNTFLKCPLCRSNFFGDRPFGGEIRRILQSLWMQLRMRGPKERSVSIAHVVEKGGPSGEVGENRQKLKSSPVGRGTWESACTVSYKMKMSEVHRRPSSGLCLSTHGFEALLRDLHLGPDSY